MDEFISISSNTSFNNTDDAANRYITTHEGLISWYDEESDEHQVGSFKALILDVASAWNDEMDLFDFFDLTQAGNDIYAALVDHESGWYWDDLEEQYGFDEFSSLFVLDRLEIKPEFRGKGLGLIAINLLIERLGVCCRLAALKAYPLQFEARRPSDTDSSDYAEFSMDKDEALASLKAYYSRAGFESYRDKHVMIRKVWL